ncbi:uncharacterized protein LOC108906485 [Anoplophora glabripennis]|uniref:uncharacterized protein LOC108906485 n=1 Tax=Anoplophora glabripennis TaxID=217634 RepID=UPI0008754A0F|nr:uncharacterized protein LOC108906485 [Anoplophora glabripennis]
MLSAVANLQTQQTQMLLTLNEILRYHRKIAMENLVEPDNLPVFPLKTLDEFLHLENLIRDDDTMKLYMVRRLAALGGSGVESITRRIMKFLISNDLAINFNWKGRFSKKAFEHTRIMRIIYDAVKQTFPAREHSDMLVANTVKEWLKHAVTRIKQGVRRQILESQQQ